MVAHVTGITDEVPTIDMAAWPEERCVEVMKAACLRTGFFYVTNHGLEALERQQFEQSRKFFALPEEVKREITMDENLRGFTPMANETLDPDNQSEGDTKEGIYFGQEIAADSKDAALPLHGPNQWPRAELLPEFRPVMSAYYDALTALGMRVMRLLALTLNLPADFFTDRFQQPLASLRPIHYSGRVSQPDDGVYGCGAHSDYGVITLLAQDDTGGLQILTKEQRWMDVPPQAGTMVVNLGDMLERWTNLRYKSTKHRVITRSQRERYSCAFFMEPGFNTVVDAHDVLPFCAPGEEPIFPPITSGDYLMMKFKNTHDGFEQKHGQEIPVQ